MSVFQITADDAGQRLDRFLRKALPAASLGQIFRALRCGDVRVNAARAPGAHRLQTGDAVELRGGLGAAATAPEPRAAPVPEPGPSGRLAVVYRDDDLLVVDKPAGLAAHPGSGVREHLLGRVHAQLGTTRGHTFVVAAAHRLDRETSGLVVFGLSARGLRGFAAALRERTVRKTYLALVHGQPAAAGEIDLALVRDDAPQGAKMQVDPAGVEARTRFRVVQAWPDRALLEVDLDTGRTHQIRAHLAAIGCPLVGDRRYGAGDTARRLCLHAWRLAFTHPVTGAALQLEAPPPAELRVR